MEHLKLDFVNCPNCRANICVDKKDTTTRISCSNCSCEFVLDANGMPQKVDAVLNVQANKASKKVSVMRNNKLNNSAFQNTNNFGNKRAIGQKYCNNCGAQQNSYDSRFCASCGCPFENPYPNQYGNQYGNPYVNPYVGRNNEKWMNTLLFLVFLGWIGGHKFYTKEYIQGSIFATGMVVWLITLFFVFDETHSLECECSSCNTYVYITFITLFPLLGWAFVDFIRLLCGSYRTSRGEHISR